MTLPEAIARIEGLLAATVKDREWYRDQAIGGRKALWADAAACAVRERAIRDALDLLRKVD